MDFHAHQVISRYLVFYVFRKTKQKKSVNLSVYGHFLLFYYAFGSVGSQF